MKRILAVVTAALLIALALPLGASAAESSQALPFELVAPQNVAVDLLGTDSPTSMRFTLSLTNEMTTFWQKWENAEGREALLSGFDYQEIWMGVQIDWALDDVNDPVSGWHYNVYWDGNKDGGLGRDDDYNYRFSEWDVVDWGLQSGIETVQDYWIMRGVPNDARWNGEPDTKTPGVKDQLRPDQYTYNIDEDTVRIDFTEHTAYFRARFWVTTRKDTEDGSKDSVYFSDWSNTVGYGKDIAAYEPLKPGTVPAPVITNLRMTDETFNDNPVVAFTMTVPDEVQTMATNSLGHGGSFYVETLARVKGDAEWTDLTEADRDIRAGERKAFLLYLAKEGQVIPKDTVIELRCRYRVEEYGQDVFYSDWSKIISFGTDDITNGSGQGSGTVTPGDDGKSSCPICHFCPQPLGLCIFIWLLIILLVIIVIVVIIVIAAKSKKKKEQN